MSPVVSGQDFWLFVVMVVVVVIYYTNICRSCHVDCVEVKCVYFLLRPSNFGPIKANSPKSVKCVLIWSFGRGMGLN